MPLYRITYRPELNRPDESVVADRAADEGRHLVLWSTVWVINRPRETVTRRLIRADVADLSESTAEDSSKGDACL